MADINSFPPEVIEQAKRLLEIKERILDVKRNLPNAAYPAQLRTCMEQLLIAFELAIFGKTTDAGPSSIPGTPVGAPDNATRIQIFMPTPQQSQVEQPPVEISRGPSPAMAPVEAAMASIVAAPPPSAGPATGHPILGPTMMRGGALDPQAEAAMAALAGARPPAPAAVASGSAVVEIFPPGHPGAPQPARV